MQRAEVAEKIQQQKEELGESRWQKTNILYPLKKGNVEYFSSYMHVLECTELRKKYYKSERKSKIK